MLQQIVNAARTTETWHAEGDQTVDAQREQSDGQPFQRSESFTVGKGGPLRSRYETAFRVIDCDGAIEWNLQLYFSGESLTPDYTKTAAREKDCKSPVLRWEDLMDSLESAVVVGTGTASFQGRNQDCILVRADYNLPAGIGMDLPTAQPVGHIRRTMCVDVSRKLILWERTEGRSSPAGDPYILSVKVSTTYRTIERVVKFDEGYFRYQPPVGPVERR